MPTVKDPDTSTALELVPRCFDALKNADDLEKKIERWKKAIQRLDLTMGMMIALLDYILDIMKKICDRSLDEIDRKATKKVVEESKEWISQVQDIRRGICKKRREVTEDKNDESLGPLKFILPVYKEELNALKEKEEKEPEKFGVRIFDIDNYARHINKNILDKITPKKKKVVKGK